MAKTNYPFRDVGKRLKQLRGKRLQADVASALDVTVRSYQRFELGERLPRVPTAAKMAEMYGVTVDLILYGPYERRLIREEDLRDSQIDALVDDLRADPLFKEILWKGRHGSREQRKLFKKLMDDLAAKMLRSIPPMADDAREDLRRKIERDIMTEMRDGDHEQKG
jgi:transcriptional regulator with XRE-family HTH domain